MGKLSLFIVAFILTGFQAVAQVNYCEIFFNAFNSAGQGFPSFRPGSVDSTISRFDVDQELLKPYGFRSGWANRNSGQNSLKFPGHVYSVWELKLNSNMINAGEMSMAEAIDRLRPEFESKAVSFYESCFKQLMMSEMYSITIEYSDDIYGYIFYPKEINLETGLNYEKALELLDEAFYIKAVLSKSVLVNSYYISYTVHGVQYSY
ncbi:MAG: hypothetical protein IPH88_00090 [Bacteroidales bacterium]|nr:hypothetical protein [Bacteroidales bacterium]